MNRTRNTRRTSRATAACILLAIVASTTSLSAFAADSVRVRRNADPNITYQRLQAAASELCGPSHDRELARHRAWMRCYEKNLQGAVEQMHEPVLMAIHRQHQKNGTTFAG